MNRAGSRSWILANSCRTPLIYNVVTVIARNPESLIARLVSKRRRKEENDGVKPAPKNGSRSPIVRRLEENFIDFNTISNKFLLRSTRERERERESFVSCFN